MALFAANHIAVMYTEMVESFIRQDPSWESVALTILIYVFLLWVPPNLSFVLAGHSWAQRIQFRLAMFGSIYLAVTISVYTITISYLVLILALVNWGLLVWTYLHRDNLDKK